MRLSFRSGLMMRLRENGLGKMTVTFLNRPSNTEKYVGILGSPEGDNTNDFMSANGTVLDTSIYSSVSRKYEGISMTLDRHGWLDKKKAPCSKIS